MGKMLTGVMVEKMMTILKIDPTITLENIFLSEEAQRRLDATPPFTRAWRINYFGRLGLTLRAVTGNKTHDDPDTQELINRHQSIVLALSDDIELDFIVNIDETPVYNGIQPPRVVAPKGARHVVFSQNTRLGTRHTVVLAVTAGKSHLPPTYIFGGNATPLTKHEVTEALDIPRPRLSHAADVAVDQGTVEEKAEEEAENEGYKDPEGAYRDDSDSESEDEEESNEEVGGDQEMEEVEQDVVSTLIQKKFEKSIPYYEPSHLVNGKIRLPTFVAAGIEGITNNMRAKFASLHVDKTEKSVKNAEAAVATAERLLKTTIDVNNGIPAAGGARLSKKSIDERAKAVEAAKQRLKHATASQAGIMNHCLKWRQFLRKDDILAEINQKLHEMTKLMGPHFSEEQLTAVRRRFKQRVLQAEGLPPPKTAFYCTQACGYMDGRVMMEWVEKVLLTWRADKVGNEEEAKSKPMLLLLDCFGAHLRSDVVAYLLSNNVFVGIVPPGCTDLVQVLDVGVNRPFKVHIRNIRLARINCGTPGLAITTTCRPSDLIKVESEALARVSADTIGNTFIHCIAKPLQVSKRGQ